MITRLIVGTLTIPKVQLLTDEDLVIGLNTNAKWLVEKSKIVSTYKNVKDYSGDDYHSYN